MNPNEWWPQYIVNAGKAALTTITKIYCDSPIFADKTFYHFLCFLKHEANLSAEIFPLDKIMPHMNQNDTVVIIGLPNDTLRYTQNVSRDCQIVYLNVPVKSIAFKFNILGQPVNVIKYDNFCFPFIPRKKCLQITCGDFCHIFLEQNTYQVKALKAAIASTAHIFGSFNRVYGIGKLSSKIASGVIDALSEKLPRVNNNLILIDRTIDMETPLRFNDTYISYISEYFNMEEYDLEIPPHVQQQIFGRPTSITTNLDTLFDDIAVQSLEDVKKRLSVIGVTTSIVNDLKNAHQSLISNIEKSMQSDYLKELLLQVQNKEKDPLTQARILGIGETKSSLAFRALSILCAQGENKKFEQYGRFLGQIFGVQPVAKWARIEEFLTSKQKIDPPSSHIGTRVGTLVAAFAQIIEDKWKRPDFPIKPNYVYTMTPLVKEPQRWFVIIPGGLCAAELAQMRFFAKSIRPDDEFVFMPTSMYSPDRLMSEILH